MSVVRPMSRLGTLAFKVPIKVPALGTVLIVNTSKSEVVHLTLRAKMFLFLMSAVPPFITKIHLGIWAWFSTGP